MRKPDLKAAKADELIAWMKFKIRQLHGDEVENNSTVYAKSGGWYYMTLALPDYPEGLSVGPFDRRGIPSVISLIKSLKESGG